MTKANGFTLIETLLYIALLSGVLVAITTITFSIVQSNQKLATANEVQYNIRFASEKITRAVRESNGINTSSSTFDSNPGTLSLSTPDAGEDPIVFDVSSGQLRVSRGSGTAIPITTDAVTVSNFVVHDRTPDGQPGNILVEMTIIHNNPSGTNIYDYEKSVEFSINNRLE